MNKIKQHTYHEYDDELKNIKNKVLIMGDIVEKQLQKSLQALLTNDKNLLLEEFVKKDAEINNLEIRIDEHCAILIAKRGPKAQDLRLIMTVIKLVTDLERIGDKAKTIAVFINKLNKNDISQGLYKYLKHLGVL